LASAASVDRNGKYGHEPMAFGVNSFHTRGLLAALTLFASYLTGVGIVIHYPSSNLPRTVIARTVTRPWCNVLLVLHYWFRTSVAAAINRLKRVFP